MSWRGTCGRYVSKPIGGVDAWSRKNVGCGFVVCFSFMSGTGSSIASPFLLQPFLFCLVPAPFAAVRARGSLGDYALFGFLGRLRYGWRLGHGLLSFRAVGLCFSGFGSGAVIRSFAAALEVRQDKTAEGFGGNVAHRSGGAGLGIADGSFENFKTVFSRQMCDCKTPLVSECKICAFHSKEYFDCFLSTLQR